MLLGAECREAGDMDTGALSPMSGGDTHYGDGSSGAFGEASRMDELSRMLGDPSGQVLSQPTCVAYVCLPGLSRICVEPTVPRELALVCGGAPLVALASRWRTRALVPPCILQLPG